MKTPGLRRCAIPSHDAMFKRLLTKPVNLADFFEAFLPEVHRFADFTDVVYVDKEQVADNDETRRGDLLVQARLKGNRTEFLIHLEHQAQPDAELAHRMLEYFALDWRREKIPVYPVVVMSCREPAGVENPLCLAFPNKQVLRFDFDVVDLARLDGSRYLSEPNAAGLALSARMRLDDRDRVQQALRFGLSLVDLRLAQDEREVVSDFFFSYRPLSEREALQMEEETAKLHPTELRQRVMEATNPWILIGRHHGREEGRQEGLQEGLHDGAAATLLRQLRRRFGILPTEQESRVRSLTSLQLDELAEALLDFQSPADLSFWLASRS